MKIKVINGPNMNMLGIREPDIYGSVSYDGLCKIISAHALDIGVEVSFFQSNSEGAIIDCIHSCYFDGYDGIVINPAAYTHYSYAIYDAIKTVALPAIEVHISDISSRESFRHESVIVGACAAQVAGKGIEGYNIALDILKDCGDNRHE
ncbi:MAG: type II 3-dehydroquinate dehydratase [Clostridia bacterium]|nr:type II 3-dehydroquinate dehydratase [Clostridia bacterium]